MKSLKSKILLLLLVTISTTFAQTRFELIGYVQGKMDRLDKMYYTKQFQNNLYPDEIKQLTKQIEISWYLLVNRIPNNLSLPQGSKQVLLEKLDNKMSRLRKVAYERDYINKLNDVTRYTDYSISQLNESLKVAVELIARGKPAEVVTPPPVIIPPVVINPPTDINPGSCSDLIKVDDIVYSNIENKVLKVIYIDPNCIATLIDESQGFQISQGSLLNDDILLISLSPYDNAANIIANSCKGVRVGDKLSFKVNSRRKRAVVLSILSNCKAEMEYIGRHSGFLSRKVTNLSRLKIIN